MHSFGGESVVVAVGERTADFRGMLRLNSTGGFLWKLMETDSTEQALAKALSDKYDVTEEQALAEVSEFVAKLSDAGVIEPWL